MLEIEMKTLRKRGRGYGGKSVEMDAGNVKSWGEGGIGSQGRSRFQCLFVGEAGDGKPYRIDWSTSGGKDRWWMLKEKKLNLFLRRASRRKITLQ